MIVTPEDVHEGFAHLDKFAAIHYGSTPAEANAAVHVLAEYLGMDDQSLGELVRHAHEYVPQDRMEAARWVIMGFLIGMTTVSRAVESR